MALAFGVNTGYAVNVTRVLASYRLSPADDQHIHDTRLQLLKNKQVTTSANGTLLVITMGWSIGMLIGVYCPECLYGANLNTADATVLPKGDHIQVQIAVSTTSL